MNACFHSAASRCLRLALVAVAAGAPASQAQTVQKVAEPFESAPWRVADDSSAGGSAVLAPEAAPELGTASKNALVLEAAFSGKGFEFFKGAPTAPLLIPGVAKRVSFWVRAEGGYGWALQFKDGWGRSEVAGSKLEWDISRGAGNTWKKLTFNVPPTWIQPITVDGVMAHNWGRQGEKAKGSLSLDHIEVETDISDVDPEIGVLRSWKPPGSPANPAPAQEAPKAPAAPLLQASLEAAEPHNVFAGERPQFRITAQNWRPQAATGTLQWKVLDADGATVKTGRQALSVEAHFSSALPLDMAKFGVYRFDSTIAWDGGKSTSSSQPFAMIPPPRELSEADKDASPYGLNVLSARQPMVSTFRKAGITWFRDYGFNFEWMVRAKGDDRKYAGWPWYPKIVRMYEDAGVRVLANLQTSIKPPVNGKLGPDRAWTTELVGMLLAFPSLRYFELDNEYDLHAPSKKAEEPIGWANYNAYHRKFGEVARILGDGQITAVENGRAGIWPERVRRAVASGDFALIDVVNSHHYTGTDAPEVNVANHNMGFTGGEQEMSFFDQLRAAKKAASADGKPRRHWLTEFGWDTKAGPMVTPRQQAAYLARAYMMLLAAGTDKGFWFFDLDAPKSTQFFDGCGLFTHEQKPKLSYASFAGLTQILPRPEYVGTINAGDGTWGYLFRDSGKLVASLWTLGGSKGPAVDFEGAKLFDAYANPLQKSTAQLGLEPVYAVGVAGDSRWLRQASYSVESPHLASVTAGDSVTATLRVQNVRSTPISGRARLQLPSGWTDASGETSIAVAPGQSQDIALTYRVGTEEPLGEKPVRVSISEAGLQHSIPLRVRIQRPIVLAVSALAGEPGEVLVKIRVSNRSAKPLDGALRFKLPASWSVATPEIKVVALKPMETREVEAHVRWASTWREGEAASVEYRSEDGRSATQPLIPSRLTIHSAPSLVMDGDLKDWPARTKLPGWVLGSTQGEANASAYLAWSSKGLHLALDVRDSKGTVPDPRSFWAGDVLEVFVDTRAKKSPRAYEPGDHQFWIAPLLNEKRAYVGQWKRGSEVAATRYDIPHVPSAVAKRGDGYVLECLLPASLLQGFKPAAGASLGLNLNLTVKGARLDREVFWAVPKSEGTEQPSSWGTVTLAQ